MGVPPVRVASPLTSSREATMRTFRTPALLLAAVVLAAACAVDGPTDPTLTAPEGASFDGAGYLGTGGRNDSTATTADGAGAIGAGTRKDSTATATDGAGAIGTGGRSGSAVSTTDGGGYIGTGGKSDSTATASDGVGYIGAGGR